MWGRAVSLGFFWGYFLRLICLLFSRNHPSAQSLMMTKKSSSLPPNSLFPGHAAAKIRNFFLSFTPKSAGWEYLPHLITAWRSELTPSLLSEHRISSSALIFGEFLQQLQVLEPLRAQDFPGEPLQVAGLKQNAIR